MPAVARVNVTSLGTGDQPATRRAIKEKSRLDRVPDVHAMRLLVQGKHSGR